VVVVAESPSANLIPPVSPAEPPSDLANILWPAKTPEQRTEQRPQQRKERGVRAALKRVMAAVGLRK